MPSFITPIQLTRSFDLKPANGLRYGNFEGFVHLPPVLRNNKLGPHSYSTLNNQQIYKTVCEWYEAWRPWQQKVLLCGIVDRCTLRQVDILATTLEPIQHRDYIVAVSKQYPIIPLKPIKKKVARKKLKKKAIKKHVQKIVDVETVDQTITGAESPVSDAEHKHGISTEQGQQLLQDGLTRAADNSSQQRSKEFSSVMKNYDNMDEFADVLATKIIDESIPKTVTIFEPSELYAQDLASSILQEALTNVETLFEEKECDMNKNLKDKRLKDLKDFKDDIPITIKPTHVVMQKRERELETTTYNESEMEKKPDLSVLDKYRKFKSPKPDRFQEFLKKETRPKSLVRVLIPDHDDTNASELKKRSGSAQSGVSRSMSAVTRSSLSDLRYRLFGSKSISAPDYFKSNGVSQLPGGSQYLRQGGVRKPAGLYDIPIPLSKMYKNIRWWSDNPHEGKIIFKAQTAELNSNFKEQLNQIWEWLHLWEDYEKIALLKEVLKLCGPEDLNFLCSHLQQKLRYYRDINRMSDKLLLYIFSFLPAEEVHTVSRVCRRWRYLCATDGLWMIKCHELGLSEGIKDLESLIVKAKGYKMVIDWRMAYEELSHIVERMKISLRKKKPKQPQKGRNVEFKEQLENLKRRDDTESEDKIVNNVNDTSQNQNQKQQKQPELDSISEASSSDISELEVELDRPRFEFQNRVASSKVAPRGSMTREELQSMIKKMLFEPEEKEKSNLSRGTPVIVELEVRRGTLSAIKRQVKRKGKVDTDDADSVVSEDLAQFDDEYKLIWEKKPERKSDYQQMPTIRAVSTDGRVEVLGQSEDNMEKIKRMHTGVKPDVGPSILRRKKQMADDAGPDDAAYDIRPELMPAQDILGKARSHLSLQWHQNKVKNEEEEEDDEDEEASRPTHRRPHFVGEVRSVLRARKLQGHMSGITCIQFDHRRLISAGLDRVIRMWDIRSGRSLHKFIGHKGGIRCLRFFGNELATGSWDTTIMIWDLRNLSRRFILTDHTDSVTCLCINADYLVSGSQDCTVRVWRRTSYLCCNVLRGHKMTVSGLAFDGVNIVSASHDKTLRLWNVHGECLHVLSGASEKINTVFLKGSLIICGDEKGQVFFWNKLSGECEAAIQAHGESVNAISYLDSRFYTASSDGTIREWDLVTMTSVRLLQGHKGPVRDLKVTMDRMVSCSDDGSIRIWDLFDPRKKQTIDEQIQQLHQECPFAPRQ